MDHNKVIAIACAVIAVVLVVIAGKSCSDDAARANRKGAVSKTTAAQEQTVVTRPPVEQNATDENDPGNADSGDGFVEHDLFGNVITTAAPETEEGSDNTETETTAAKTDAFGEPVTLAPVGAEGEDETEGTTAPPVISGFNHGEYDEEGNTIPPKPTLPPDFTLIIQ